MTLYYEDVEIGARFVTATHEITAADIAAFGHLTRDNHPLHTDPAYAIAAGFPGVIAHGLYGLALMEGLKTELELFQTTSIASLGWNKVRFAAPIPIGAVLHVEMEFLDKRESQSKPAGIVTEGVRLLFADASTAIDAEHVTLVQRRQQG